MYVHLDVFSLTLSTQLISFHMKEFADTFFESTCQSHVKDIFSGSHFPISCPELLRLEAEFFMWVLDMNVLMLGLQGI